jgi:hypothetical protein
MIKDLGNLESITLIQALNIAATTFIKKRSLLEDLFDFA